MVRAAGEGPEVVVVGDEDVSESAAGYIDGLLKEDETPIAVSAFDDEMKVLTITDQRILVVDEEAGEDTWRLVLTVSHDDLLRFERDGRTLIIEPRQTGERRYKFGQDQTVEKLVQMARSHQTSQIQPEGSRESRRAGSDVGQSSIAERVRFWEEQDKINQELIPRVIRQNELLTKHIAEHDSLPEVASRAISEALAEAREEHRQQYEAALDAAKRELAEQSQATLDQTLATARQDMQQQYDGALDAAKKELAEQAQTRLDQTLAALSQEARKTRKVLVGLASVAVASGVAGLIVALLT